MSQWTPGSHFEVTHSAAPFHEAFGVVDEIEEGKPYPLVCTVQRDGKPYTVSYREDEVMPVAGTLVPPAGKVAGA